MHIGYTWDLRSAQAPSSRHRKDAHAIRCVTGIMGSVAVAGCPEDIPESILIFRSKAACMPFISSTFKGPSQTGCAILCDCLCETMTNNPPILFDHQAVQRNMRRAAGMDKRHTFLKAEIADRLHERLQEVNRPFPKRIDLGGGFAPYLPQAEKEAYTNIPARDGVLNTEPSSADLVVANLGLHWVNDLPGLLVQIKNALRPDGLFCAALFGGQTLHELRHSLITAESEICGGATARVIPFADVKDLGSLLQRAGFSLPVTDMDTLTLTYEHPLNLMQELRGMGEANALAARPRTFWRRDVLLRACNIYQQQFSRDDGRVAATFEVMYLTGWHPHESQQKPLKPGSGEVNLADALKAGKPPEST